MPLNIDKIRKLMGKKFDSQEGLAVAMGIKQSGIGKILSGKKDQKLSTIERLAAALGCKAKDLLQ